jgi:DNA-binding winged helix-turn-helix (wHTH) protein
MRSPERPLQKLLKNAEMSADEDLELMQPADHRTFRFLDFVLDRRRGRLSGKGGEIELRRKSFEVLCYFLENADRVIAKSEIIDAVWPNAVVTDTSLVQCVRDVRLALSDHDARIIRAVWGRGYVFTAPVFRSDGEEGSGQEAAPGPGVAAGYAAGARLEGQSELAVRARDVGDLHELKRVTERQKAQRRQVTVLACEWVGLPTSVDPEDLQATVAACQQHCAEIVAPFRGRVTRTVGGALIHFGVPTAREHDAEDAVRAGLALLASTAGLAVQLDAPLQLRIGAASGIVVIEDETGGWQQPVGEAPHLAIRLRAATQPDHLLIDQTTHRLVGGLFEYDDPVVCDDPSGPVQAWRVRGPSPVESRFEALRPGDLGALVGREDEMDLLRRRWQRAKAGAGQVVLLCGEAGIGKSRLAAALLEKVAAEPHELIRYFCSPHHTQSELHPLIRGLEHAAGFVPDEAPAAMSQKLDALLEQTSTPLEDRALFADLLSVGAHGQQPMPDFTHRERRSRIIQAVMRRLETQARRAPVVAVFEDVHWIDPTSLDVLNRMVEPIARLRVLLIISFRPDFAPPWAGAPHVTLLTLNRLAPPECRELMEPIAGNKQIPADFIDEIIARSDGVPLHLEELTKAVIEAGLDAPAETARASARSGVPATLHASLMARLDRLGSAREVAQIGAAVGREFSFDVLAAVAPFAEPELVDALDRLTEAGLLLREGRPPHASFQFKHALVQEAAYGTLVRRARRELRAHRQGFGRARLADPGCPAGAPRPPLFRGRAGGVRSRLLGQGRRAGAAPIGVPGGDRASRPGHRHRRPQRAGRHTRDIDQSPAVVADRLCTRLVVCPGQHRAGNFRGLRAGAAARDGGRGCVRA